MHSVYRGRPKNSSSCVTVEYSSQATSTNPHFFGIHPPLCLFLGGSGRFNYFYCDIALAGRELWFDFHYVITKCSSENLCSGNRGNPHWTGQGVCTSSHKTRSEAVLLFNFSTPCQAQLFGQIQIILIWYFFTFCLLEISCNREGVLFANHFHLLFIIFWMMLLIIKYYYLRIIIIWISLAFT